MSILVFGQTGQVARELALLSRPEAPILCLPRSEADLVAPEACASAIRIHGPRAVINAAAYTAVDGAERQPALAHLVNAEAPGTMARTCADLGIPFVQISTDYVFDGTGDSPWQPGDAAAPCNVYGRSKLAGEQAVLAAGGAYAVLRTSWVVSAHGSNFVKTMLRLGKTRDAVSVVADQIGGPTPARAIAQACRTIAETLCRAPEKSGIYHFSGAPDTSWAGFARETFSRAGLACAVTEIPTTDYPTPAARPLNSRLDCTATEAAFGLARPDWRQGLTEILQDLGEI